MVVVNRPTMSDNCLNAVLIFIRYKVKRQYVIQTHFMTFTKRSYQSFMVACHTEIIQKKTPSLLAAISLFNFAPPGNRNGKKSDVTFTKAGLNGRKGCCDTVRVDMTIY